MNDLPTYPAFLSWSPFRTPTWRMDRARFLLSAGRYASRRRDDEWTCRALHYLRTEERLQKQGKQDRLARQYPDVHAARQLHEKDGDRAVEVQARLLARQSPEEIASIMALPASLITAYEALFYQVTDRLDALDWIATKAIGWFNFNPAVGRDRAMVLRCFAYHGGPLVLEEFLPYLLYRTQPLEPGPPQLQDPKTRGILLAIAIQMLPYTDDLAFKLFRIHAELIAAEQKKPAGGPKDAPFARNLDQMLDELASGALQQHARRATEVTTEEAQPFLGRTG